MTDRLTQLQVCLDQLVAQFNATINYVNINSEPALLDEEDPNQSSSSSYFNIAASAPLPGAPQAIQEAQTRGSPGVLNSSAAPEPSVPTSNKQSPSASAVPGGDARAEAEQNFENTINELSTDIILKSRQLSMLIDSLPGIGVSPTNQLKLIEELAMELEEVEKERLKKLARRMFFLIGVNL